MRGTIIDKEYKLKDVVPEHLLQEYKAYLQLHSSQEVPQNEQYDQFSLEIRKYQHQRDKMQRNLKQNLSFCPCKKTQEDKAIRSQANIKKVQTTKIK